MKFLTTAGPFQRGKRTTLGIMLELSAALAVIWLAAIVYNFVAIGWQYGLKAILMVVISLVSATLADIFVGAIRYKKTEGVPMFAYLWQEIVHNYSYVTALIFALTLPLGTPYYVIIVGTLFGVLVVKYAFGGFGSNVFNPAALARIFVGLSFTSSLTAIIPGVSVSVPTLVSGATITSQYASLGTKWLTDSLSGLSVSMSDLFLGFYSGALGETFTLLILAVAVYLSIRKVINWRTPVFYLGTVAVVSVIIALITGLNPLDYSLIALGMGGLAFGAVFMLTDPVTSPTSPFGKALIGIIAGFITVLIRIQGNLPEGVIYSIALVNIAVPVVDKLAVGLTNLHTGKKWGVIAAMAAVAVGVNGSLAAFNIKGSSSSSSSSSETPPVEVYRSFVGSASSSPCEECAVQTMTVTVDVDEAYDILDITIAEAATSGGSFATKWSTGYPALLAYYQDIGIKGIQDSTATLPLPEGGFIASVSESSLRFVKALKDAVGAIGVYQGSATSSACDDYCDEQTLYVTVYVEDETIAALKLDGGITSGSNAYLSSWTNGYPAVLDYYRGMSVATFKALVAAPSEGLVAGVTVTSNRLFDAMQNALASYGG